MIKYRHNFCTKEIPFSHFDPSSFAHHLRLMYKKNVSSSIPKTYCITEAF